MRNAITVLELVIGGTFVTALCLYIAQGALVMTGAVL